MKTNKKQIRAKSGKSGVKQSATKKGAGSGTKSGRAKGKQSTALTVRGAAQVQKNGMKRDIFQDATQVEILGSKMAVTKKVSKTQNGKFTSREEKHYVERNDANLAKLNRAIGGRKVKSISVKFAK